MKRLYWLIPAALLLTACDRKSAPDAFTPEMASFSNEFEFDPLRGPVKDFSQTLLDEHDVVVKKVSAQLSREGCFDLLTPKMWRTKPAPRCCWTPTITSTGAPTRSGCACRASVSWRRCLPPG